MPCQVSSATSSVRKSADARPSSSAKLVPPAAGEDEVAGSLRVDTGDLVVYGNGSGANGWPSVVLRSPRPPGMASSRRPERSGQCTFTDWKSCEISERRSGEYGTECHAVGGCQKPWLEKSTFFFLPRLSIPPPSYAKDDHFTRLATFSRPLASDVQAPAGLASTVATRWKEIITTFPSLSIAESVSGVATQSINAADRYRKLKPIANANPSWALPAVLLAGTHFLLNELHGARRLLERARAVVGVGADTFLDRAILHVQELGDPVALTCSPSTGPASRPTSTGPRVDDSLARWQRLQTQKTVDVAIEQFARNAALQTNVLEGVFALDGLFWPLLVGRGFFENSIAGFSRLSKIKKPKKAKIMQNDDVAYEEDDEDRDAILIPVESIGESLVILLTTKKATYLKEEMDQAMEDIANLSVDLAVEIPGSPASSTSEAPSTPSPLQNVIAAVEALRV
ncbi:hypothetical protein BDZ88DRAFT_441657 [Geranomyces variabilis]|nr:hypothetical protein BDZ88DRAFT_441657 [Geranomyces variabilis]KAJ3133983.1 hypothetical protein HDU90_005331 [Geranomyces variabilis]